MGRSQGRAQVREEKGCLTWGNVVDILLKRHYTPLQVKREELALTEFKPNHLTSSSARVDNMTALGKAVILCDDHSRKFTPFKVHYMAHPDPQMKRVHGRCDDCQMMGLQHLFLNEKDGLEQREGLDKFRRSLEYATILNG